MKINKIEIEGFRGALPPFELKLGGKNACIYAENGFGKSTIADALEYWSSGDVVNFHAAGCGLDACIHVDAQQAVVTVHPTSSGPVRRKLAGRKAGTPEVVDQVADPGKVAGLPLLRYETVSRFMQKTSGEKKRELLELFGLEELSEFRDAIRSAKTLAKRHREEARGTQKSERQALIDRCNQEDPTTYANRLLKEATLQGVIVDEADIEGLELSPPPVGSAPKSLQAVEELTKRIAASNEGSTDLWNSFLEDRSAVQERAVAALLREGEKVMADWPDDSCPLCESDYQRGTLAVEISQRAAQLVQVEQRFGDAQQALSLRAAGWREYAGAVKGVIENAPDSGWPNLGLLSSASTRVAEHAAALDTALREMQPAPEPPELDLAAELEVMREAAAATMNPKTKALLLLAGLQQQVERVVEAEKKASTAEQAEACIEQLLLVADSRIEAVINAAINQLGELVSQYYLKLSGSSLYSNIKLVYEPKAAGGAEFSICFDGRKDCKPPQRIMSNGQLNGLALAFFLARLTVERPHWQAMVLDDVVSSFGGVHRRGVLDLLATEFAQHQVLLLTHDKTFALLAQERLASGWKHLEISQWTPSGGPVLSEGSALNRLRKRLQEGHSASELTSFAREALEFELAKPLGKLQYSIEYKPSGRYTGKDYFDALYGGLKAAESSLADAAVFNRMASNGFISNLGSHYQPVLAAPDVADLVQLADDLVELRDLFTCDSCGRPVWQEGRSAGKHHCDCKALAA